MHAITTPFSQAVYSPLHFVVVPDGLVVGPHAGSVVHAVWDELPHFVDLLGLCVHTIVFVPEQIVCIPGAEVTNGALLPSIPFAGATAFGSSC